jgi:hypothetical protein
MTSSAAAPACRNRLCRSNCRSPALWAGPAFGEDDVRAGEHVVAKAATRRKTAGARKRSSVRDASDHVTSGSTGHPFRGRPATGTVFLLTSRLMIGGSPQSTYMREFSGNGSLGRVAPAHRLSGPTATGSLTAAARHRGDENGRTRHRSDGADYRCDRWIAGLEHLHAAPPPWL